MTATSALAKLIGLGIKGWSAIETRAFDDKDLSAIQALLETGASLASLRGAATPAAAAQHLALVARSFGQAVGRHQEFHGRLLLTGPLRSWLDRGDRQRAREIELRVELARLHVRDVGNDPRGEVDFARALTHPLDTPYYRKLWQAFSDPALTLEGEQPPLVMSQTARREFERYFLLAYLTALESPAGRGVTAYLDGMRRYRTTLVRDLLLEDMAAWGGRHVFGNVPRERWAENEPVPFLPLDALYVEVTGKLKHASGQRDEAIPLLDLLEQLATSDRAPYVVLVLADFGSGKSLSARMLAQRWAERALAAASVSLDEILPIYVRCAEDFPHEAVDLPATVRRAWKRQADGFGFSIPEDDDALAWPPDAQRVVCLLDGLDEIALGDQHLKTLFHKLRGRATARQRFIVFSRPGALPPRGELGDGVAVVRVQPFEPVQIERWLAGWNQLHAGTPPVTLPAIHALGLGELARTPILLFMIAFTWGRYTAATDRPSLAAIYEGFIGQIAAGKAAADRERHGPITAASEALLAALRNREVLDDRAAPSDAMLWLLGRVAWEAQMLEQRRPPEVLTRRHIDNLLHDDDLRLPSDALPAIQLGLVLALQSDLRSADHRILFGHQSFREFLVGRHWATQLHRIVRGNPRDWERETDDLAGGRLLGPENRAFAFLMQIINAPGDPRSPSPRAWSDPDREALVRWAQDVFCDERQLFSSRARPARRDDTRLRDDQRAVLREAALAIGSLTSGSPGLHARDPATLRTLLPWFWVHGVLPIIIAPRARLAGANLSNCDLQNALLEGAILDGAVLDRARLHRARLDGASLRGAEISAANLFRASLDRANLDGASLFGTTLARASLNEASLLGTEFDQADLQGASLHEARLDGAIFIEASLHRAHFDGASLDNAIFDRARLDGASLCGASLDGARFDGASLCGASLDGANLDGASLHEARYDEQTVWPEGFDPAAGGAVRVSRRSPPPMHGEQPSPAAAGAGSLSKIGEHG